MISHTLFSYLRQAKEKTYEENYATISFNLWISFWSPHLTSYNTIYGSKIQIFLCLSYLPCDGAMNGTMDGHNDMLLGDMDDGTEGTERELIAKDIAKWGKLEYIVWRSGLGSHDIPAYQLLII